MPSPESRAHALVSAHRAVLTRAARALALGLASQGEPPAVVVLLVDASHGLYRHVQAAIAAERDLRPPGSLEASCVAPGPGAAWIPLPAEVARQVLWDAGYTGAADYVRAHATGSRATHVAVLVEGSAVVVSLESRAN